MGEFSDIEYVDSTINPMMGCDGCELFNPKWKPDDPRNTCYANTLVSRYAGHSKGYPVSFATPTLFTERIAQACKWRDLTGTDRPDKPWLNGMPRVIFLDDLGDTFTESLPIGWLLPYMPQIEASPHIWLMFTKRPKRMTKFFSLLGHVPKNVWPFTSVTGPDHLTRIDDLLKIDSPNLCVSIEPLFAEIDIRCYLISEWLAANGPVAIECEHGFDCCPKCDGNNRTLAWVVAGFESGARAKPGHPDWARSLRDQCVQAGKPFFWKQWGEWLPIETKTVSAKVATHEGRLIAAREECGYYCEEEFGHVDHKEVAVYRVGKKAAGRLLDGRTWDEMPK